MRSPTSSVSFSFLISHHSVKAVVAKMSPKDPVLGGTCVRIAPFEGVSIRVWRAKKHNCGARGEFKEGTFSRGVGGVRGW